MLLAQFRRTFEGQPYLHRRSNTGDKIAECLYDDLAVLNRSPKLTARVLSGQVVVNTRNRVTGRVGRRGDGTFGERVPTIDPFRAPGQAVGRGAVADVEIGTEVKLLATKMVAQVDRVMTDLENQAEVFRSLNSRGIRVAIVGVNHADSYTGYEGKRVHPARFAPSRESAEIIRRLEQRVRSRFDELIVLRFRATNSAPFGFEWVNETETRDLYASALVRLSAEYEARF
jgi:hypothetical protein